MDLNFMEIYTNKVTSYNKEGNYVSRPVEFKRGLTSMASWYNMSLTEPF